MRYKTPLNNYLQVTNNKAERNILKYKDIDGNNLRDGSQLIGAWMSDSRKITYTVVKNKKGYIFEVIDMEKLDRYELKISEDLLKNLEIVCE